MALILPSPGPGNVRHNSSHPRRVRPQRGEAGPQRVRPQPGGEAGPQRVRPQPREAGPRGDGSGAIGVSRQAVSTDRCQGSRSGRRGAHSGSSHATRRWTPRPASAAATAVKVPWVARVSAIAFRCRRDATQATVQRCRSACRSGSSTRRWAPAARKRPLAAAHRRRGRLSPRTVSGGGPRRDCASEGQGEPKPRRLGHTAIAEVCASPPGLGNAPSAAPRRHPQGGPKADHRGQHGGVGVGRKRPPRAAVEGKKPLVVRTGQPSDEARRRPANNRRVRRQVH